VTRARIPCVYNVTARREEGLRAADNTMYPPLADDYEVAVTGHSTSQAPHMFRSATQRRVRVPAGGL
jgi:hypothetical protein